MQAQAYAKRYKVQGTIIDGRTKMGKYGKIIIDNDKKTITISRKNK